jgi:hypothetical protein
MFVKGSQQTTIKEDVMNIQIKKVIVWLLATSLVLAAAAMLIPKNAVASIAAQVFLVNHSVPASNPLPVSGNVGINAMPPVQLAPGTTVGVTGGTFNFSNTPSTPIFTRDINNGSRQGVQLLILFNILDGTTGNDANALDASFVPFIVPAGKALVIEEASALAGMPVGQRPLSFQVGVNDIHSFLPFTFQGTSASGVDAFVAGRQFRAYVGPGKLVQVGVTRDSGTGLANIIGDITGYLVECTDVGMC